MAIQDNTPNIQRFTALAGSTERMAKIDADGDLLADDTIIEAKLSDATAILLLTNESNWDAAGAYTGTAITGTYQGQWYNDTYYYFTAVADNSWIRLPRAASVVFTFESSTSNIKMDGVVSVGVLTTVPRADHVHPSDTSKANLSGAVFSGDISVEKNNAVLDIMESGATGGDNGVRLASGDSTYSYGQIILSASSSQHIFIQSLEGNINEIYSNGGIIDFRGHTHKLIQLGTNISSFTHNRDYYNAGKVNNQEIDFSMEAPIGSMYDMETFTFYARASTSGVEITWNPIFRSLGATLPATALTANKWYSMIFIYNSTDNKWDLMSLVVEP